MNAPTVFRNRCNCHPCHHFHQNGIWKVPLHQLPTPIWAEVYIWQNFEVMCLYPTCKNHWEGNYLTCLALQWEPVSASKNGKFPDAGKEVKILVAKNNKYFL